MCNTLDELCGVHTNTSDQHVDLRASGTIRDAKNSGAFNWLRVLPSFFCPEHKDLVSISPGFAVEEEANVDKAYEIENVIGKAVFGYSVKLKRRDRVTSISSATN